VSWNGATEVEQWQVYSMEASTNKTTLTKTIPKDGFETHTRLDGWIRYVLVEAIDITGKSLGKSRIIQTLPSDRDAEQFIDEQKWLQEHVDSTKIEAMLPETYSEGLKSMAPDDPDIDEYSDSWASPVTNHVSPELLTYIGGFFTCLLAFALSWMALRLRRKFLRARQIQKYTQLEKDEHEDDYELDESLEGDRFSSRGGSIDSEANGQIQR
jgi:hypothetical protein